MNNIEVNKLRGTEVKENQRLEDDIHHNENSMDCEEISNPFYRQKNKKVSKFMNRIKLLFIIYETYIISHYMVITIRRLIVCNY